MDLVAIDQPDQPGLRLSRRIPVSVQGVGQGCRKKQRPTQKVQMKMRACAIQAGIVRMPAGVAMAMVLAAGMLVTVTMLVNRRCGNVVVGQVPAGMRVPQRRRDEASRNEKP